MKKILLIGTMLCFAPPVFAGYVCEKSTSFGTCSSGTSSGSEFTVPCNFTGVTINVHGVGICGLYPNPDDSNIRVSSNIDENKICFCKPVNILNKGRGKYVTVSFSSGEDCSNNCAAKCASNFPGLG